jgi:ComF family protein
LGVDKQGKTQEFFMRGLARFLQTPLFLLLDLIAPRRCAACEVEALPLPGAFCQECFAACTWLQQESEGAWGLLAFEGPVQRAIHRVKYERNDQAASALGVMLGASLPKEFLSFELVIPIPVGEKRLRERGFDQAAILAREVSLALGLRFSPLGLRRQRETKALAKLDRQARHVAISGAFVASSLVRNRRVILVDDVVTTGATTNEAKEALGVAGASAISVICVGKTLKQLG